MRTLEPAQSTPPEPSGGPATAKMPSERPVLSSTTVVWGEWAAWPLEAPGGYFYFPDNRDACCLPALIFLPRGRGEKQGRGSATVREGRKEAERAPCAGTPTWVTWEAAGSRPLSGREEGAFGGRDGIWIHLIRSEE